MLIEIYKDSNKVWEYEVNHTKIDLFVIPANLIKDCEITLEAFDELFFNELKDCQHTRSPHHEAYERAEQIHINFFGKKRFKNYETYSSTKSRKLNR